MDAAQRKIIREQLDKTLGRFSILMDVQMPVRGWIRAVRDALGMNIRQLAERLGVSSSRVVRIEQDEISGALTLRTMQRVADKLDCVFVYGFVPRTSLEETVQHQAQFMAKDRMQGLMHTMALEDQALTPEDQKKMFMRMVEETMNSKGLWENKSP